MTHYSSTLHHPLPNHANEKKEINTNWKFVFKSCTWAYKYRLWTIIIIKEPATWFELITQQEKNLKNKPPPIKPLVYNPPDWLSAMVICNTLFYALHWVRQFFFSFYLFITVSAFHHHSFFVVVNWDDKNLQWTFSLTKNMLVSWRPSASEQVQQVTTNKRYWNSNYDYFLNKCWK